MEANSNLIYFNNNGGTHIDPEVSLTVQQFAENNAGNTHTLKKRVNEARQQISEFINCKPQQLVFTKSTSDGINLGLKAVYESLQKKGNHVITNVTEHPAILNACEQLKSQGATVSYLSVNKEGLVDVDDLKHSITKNTVLVAIMACNNETGVIQPIETIAELCAIHNITFFSDGSQYVGKIRCDVQELGFDLTAFSAYKIYGPKNAGVLYVREPGHHSNIKNTIDETDPASAALIVGMGKMAEVAARDHWQNTTHLSKLRTYFEHHLLDVEGLRINGSTRHRLYNTSNIQFPNNSVAALANKYVFSHNQNSHVLKAMGLSSDEVSNSFRFSFGKYNTLEEVKLLTQDILLMMNQANILNR